MAYLRKNVGTVTGIVTEEDLNTSTEAVRQDVNILALREAVTENRVATNLPNSFLDQFQDDSGIDTETTTDRNASEYMEAVAPTYPTATIWDWANDDVTATTANWSTNASAVVSTSNLFNDWFMIDGQDSGNGGIHSAGNSNSSIHYDFGASHRWASLLLGKRQQHGDWNAATISYSANNSDWTGVDFTGWSATDTGGTNYVISGATYYFSGTPSGNGKLNAMGSDGVINWAQMGTNAGLENQIKQIVTGFTAFEARYLRIVGSSQHAAINTNAAFSAFGWYVSDAILAVAATGSVIGNANVTSSAKTKVSGVILYKNAHGTNALATDLKTYFTCNGGTNWTEAVSYTEVSAEFSSGVKMVKLGETTCTSGSDIRYKVEWANQVASTKIAYLYGVGLNY